MDSKKSQNHNPISGARKVQEDLNGSDYRLTRNPPASGDRKDSPKGISAKPKKKREVTIRYQDELGYDLNTKTFKAHFRLANRTYTLDTGKDTIDAAMVWLKNHKVSLVNHATSGIIPGLTVRQALALYMNLAPSDASRRRTPSLDSVQDVGKRWKHGILKTHGDVPIHKLDKNVLLDEIIRYTNASGPYGPHTLGGVRSYIINLNIPFRFVLRKGWVAHIPTLPVIPDTGRPVIHFVPPYKLLELLELFDRYVGYDLYAMLYIRLMAFSGLRTDNARNLRKEYFDLDLGMFDTGPTKNRRRYTFPIPEDVKTLLERVPDMDIPGLLFPSSLEGGVRAYDWCLPKMKKACKTLGIRTARAWHSFRAAHAIALLRSGVDVTVVKELLGHETLVMVLRYAGTEQRDLVEGLAKSREYLYNKAREERQRGLSAH